MQAITIEVAAVPPLRLRGNNASLLCKYKLEPNEDLISLKWYKDEIEFYRFTPPDPTRIRQQHQYTSYQQNRNRHGSGNGWSGGGAGQYGGYAAATRPNEGNVQTWKVPGIKIDESFRSLFVRGFAITPFGFLSRSCSRLRPRSF